MGKRGPKRTPTNILAARGSWLAKVRGGMEPVADGRPQPPSWLVGSAKDVWDAMLPMLVDMGIVGRIDSNAIARYCQVLAWWIECKEFIAQYGSTTAHKTDDGRVEITEFPQVSRVAKLGEQLLRIEREFGMTSASRAGMAMEVNKRDKDREVNGIAGYINPKLVG